MKEKIQVLNVQLNNMTAKEAMKKVIAYVQSEPLNVVEMVTMQALSKFREEEHVNELFESFDVVLASDKELLQVAGVEDERRLKEVEEVLFIKMVMRYLHRNGVRVFLLAETENDLQKLETYMKEDYGNIQVVEAATMEKQGTSDDMILNLINGSETSCILSALPSPMEEQFVYKNRSLISGKLWIGFGNLLDEMKKDKSSFEKIRRLVMRILLKKEMTKKGENA